MYLRVSKLSDITTNNGLYIQEGYLDGTRINPYTTNEWPRQLLPSRQAWKVWNHHIKKTFYNGSTLRQPLGSWLTDLPQAHTRFLPTTQQLVQIKQHGIFVASTTMNRKTIMHHANWTQQLSIDKSIPLIEDTNPQTIPNDKGYVSTLEKTWEQQQHHQWNKYQQTLLHFTPTSKYITLDLLSAETIYIVSDGGTVNNEGYYGWVIATSSTIIIEGHGYVPGNPSQIDSLRAESMGMLHALTVMSKQQQNTNCKGNLILASDNLELINRTQTFNEYGNRFAKQYVAPHMDIQCAIDTILEKDFPHIEVQHVFGHQDTKKSTALTWLEYLNV